MAAMLSRPQCVNKVAVAGDTIKKMAFNVAKCTQLWLLCTAVQHPVTLQPIHEKPTIYRNLAKPLLSIAYFLVKHILFTIREHIKSSCFFISWWIFLKFCTEHSSHTAVLYAKCQEDLIILTHVMRKYILQAFCLSPISKDSFHLYRPPKLWYNSSMKYHRHDNWHGHCNLLHIKWLNILPGNKNR